MPVLLQLTRWSLSVVNWWVSFFVDLSVKKMRTVPEVIRKQIELPGVYGVGQLMIDFGTADSLNFSWDDWYVFPIFRQSNSQ